MNHITNSEIKRKIDFKSVVLHEHASQLYFNQRDATQTYWEYPTHTLILINL